MSNINSLLESSANGWKNMQSDAARMAAKWGKTGLLEGLNSEIEKNSMALILENQAKQLVTEASATNQGGATFTAGQGAQWAGVALPLVRKVFGSLSSKEFLSVQPMNLPSGLVFWLDFKYGNNRKYDYLVNDLLYCGCGNKMKINSSTKRNWKVYYYYHGSAMADRKK